ncbi:hypothetical protein [Mycobacterium sp. ACS1612]|uniref:hypothetical protein n=1 Tax=Mycobacterium sp. ACS1612 TaxID=1834117 RepID=UPI000ABE5EFA|nr:hypothetical protein [Mycobacterium sp. ACS1612]
MLTKPQVAVATVAAVLAVSAGLPIGQSATGMGVGIAAASPCPPFLPCQGPPKPPKLPGLGGGGGPKAPKLPGLGGGGGPKAPKLPDFGGGGGPKAPKLPGLGGGGGPKGPKLPDFGGGGGPKGPKLPGPADVRHAFTVGGPRGAVNVEVPDALRVPKNLRPDFRVHVPGLGRLTPNVRWPGGPAGHLRGDWKAGWPWLARPHVDLGPNFRWRWPGRVPGDFRAGFHWRVSPRDLRVDFRVGPLLDFSADWRGLRLRLGPPPWHGGVAPLGLGPAPWGWGPPPPPNWAGWIPPPWGPAPAPFDYWGITVIPVWDPYFQQWGFWEFGVWVPLPGQ